jgi:hypothetical protein
MPTGLRTILADGTVVQIDQDTRGWQLKETGTITYDQSVPYDESGVGRYGIITVTSVTTPLIAITGTHAVRWVYKSGTTWKFRVVGPLDSPAAQATYYVFEPGPSLLETQGLAIWDASGNLCFQSGAKPLRIVGNGAGTYASGRTYAAVCLQVRTGNDTEVFPNEEVPEVNDRSDYGYIRGVDVASNVVSLVDLDMYFIITSPAGSGIGEWTPANPPILVVDVTGF